MKTHTKVHLFSLKKNVGSLFILLMLTSCSFAQKQDDPSPKNQPNVHIDVKRQLDKTEMLFAMILLIRGRGAMQTAI